jgi:glycosyltransferase involved in cell wall biosynthesis
LRILIHAYACNPARGSEEGVGWGWICALAARHDLHVITADFHRADIEAACHEQSERFRNVTFHYVRNRPWHYRPTQGWRFVESTVLKPIMNAAYRLWMRDAFEQAFRLHTQQPFDLVHLITYVGFRFPGYYWKLDIPFVWGPIGGLENTPWRFLPSLGPAGCLFYAGRNVINSAEKRLNPNPRQAFHKARGSIIAATEGIRREILKTYGYESEVICEIGPPPVIAETPSLRESGEPLRLVWSGQHQPGKALPLLLKALATIGGRMDYELTVLGTGRCTRAWHRLARRLGIDDRCRWPGWIPRDEAVRLMGRAHVAVITSLKDLTSTVLLESLAAGLPVICPDHCGFSNVVTSDCGIKLPVRSPRQLVEDFAAAIERLAGDETERRRLAAGALRRIADFSWEKKAEMVDRIYRRALGEAGTAAECQNVKSDTNPALEIKTS